MEKVPDQHVLLLSVNRLSIIGIRLNFKGVTGKRNKYLDVVSNGFHRESGGKVKRVLFISVCDSQLLYLHLEHWSVTVVQLVVHQHKPSIGWTEANSSFFFKLALVYTFVVTGILQNPIHCFLGSALLLGGLQQETHERHVRELGVAVDDSLDVEGNEVSLDVRGLVDHLNEVHEDLVLLMFDSHLSPGYFR